MGGRLKVRSISIMKLQQGNPARRHLLVSRVFPCYSLAIMTTFGPIFETYENEP